MSTLGLLENEIQEWTRKHFKKEFQNHVCELLQPSCYNYSPDFLEYLEYEEHDELEWEIRSSDEAFYLGAGAYALQRLESFFQNHQYKKFVNEACMNVPQEIHELGLAESSEVKEWDMGFLRNKTGLFIGR